MRGNEPRDPTDDPVEDHAGLPNLNLAKDGISALVAFINGEDQRLTRITRMSEPISVIRAVLLVVPSPYSAVTVELVRTPIRCANA